MKISFKYLELMDEDDDDDDDGGGGKDFIRC
jgi:hypothetical protein